MTPSLVELPDTISAANAARCPRRYVVTNHGHPAWEERCVRATHPDTEPCRLNLLLPLAVEPLGLFIATGVDVSLTVRRIG